MAREGVAPFFYVSAASGVGGGLGAPVGERICCECHPGGMIVSGDDRGERRRGSAVAPRVTLGQDAFERADVAHGPGQRRAGFWGIPSGPEHCPQFTPPFHEFGVAQKTGCRRGHTCGSLPRLLAGLASTAAWQSRSAWSGLDAYSVFQGSGFCAALRPPVSFHRWGANVRFDFWRWQWFGSSAQPEPPAGGRRHPLWFERERGEGGERLRRPAGSGSLTSRRAICRDTRLGSTMGPTRFARFW